jgi:hypothetical protein
MGAFWEHQNPKEPKPFRNELLKLFSRPWTKGSSILQKTLDLDLTILLKHQELANIGFYSISQYLFKHEKHFKKFYKVFYIHWINLKIIS